MWQLHYLHATELMADRAAEAERDRLARAAHVARPRDARVGWLRRYVAGGARAVERAAESVASWADPSPA